MDDVTATPNSASRARSSSTGCCTDVRCESGLRNNYFEGKRITPDMFRIEQQYAVEKRRLLNRAIHGWGVVYGYALGVVTPTSGYRKSTLRRLEAGPGLALDECGRELLLVGSELIDLAQIIVLDKDGKSVDADKAFLDAAPNAYARQSTPEMCWLLSVHYAEQPADYVKVSDPCRCQHGEWDHVCESVRFSLRRIPCGDCCNDVPCGLTCACQSGPCCDHHHEDDPYGAPTVPVKDDPGKDDPVNEKPGGNVLTRPTGREVGSAEVTANVGRLIADEIAGRSASVETTASPARTMPDAHAHRPGHPFKRGGCQCLCHHVTNLLPGGDCPGRLCEIDEPCGHVKVDLTHGVPLACLDIVRDPCGDWTFGPDVEACGPRRLVKNNDLLFDLVRGCDLTHISEVGWAKWHRHERHVMFKDFNEGMGPDGENQPVYVTNDFWVKFSRPVRKHTVRPDCFAMTILHVDDEGGWWVSSRVPIVKIDTSVVPPETGDPADVVRGARIVVDGAWVEDGLRGRHTIFLEGDTRIEIEVRGDLILDCNGQAIDANARGLASSPTGNGAPGGTFFSSFHVAKAPPHPGHGRATSSHSTDGLKGASS